MVCHAKRSTRKWQGVLLAVPGPNGRRRFPAVQFRDDGQVIGGMKDVQAALGFDSRWSVLVHIQPHDLLGDERPVDALRRGDLDRVLQAASGVHAGWAPRATRRSRGAYAAGSDAERGAKLHRFYNSANDPVFFDRTDEGERALNAPDVAAGVLYVAKHARGAFAESFLRSPGRRVVDPALLRERPMSRCASGGGFQLIHFDGPALAALGDSGGRARGAALRCAAGLGGRLSRSFATGGRRSLQRAPRPARALLRPLRPRCDRVGRGTAPIGAGRRLVLAVGRRPTRSGGPPDATPFVPRRRRLDPPPMSGTCQIVGRSGPRGRTARCLPAETRG